MIYEQGLAIFDLRSAYLSVNQILRISNIVTLQSYIKATFYYIYIFAQYLSAPTKTQ